MTQGPAGALNAPGKLPKSRFTIQRGADSARVVVRWRWNPGCGFPFIAGIVLFLAAGMWWLVFSAIAEFAAGHGLAILNVLMSLGLAIVVSLMSWATLVMAVNRAKLTLAAETPADRDTHDANPYRHAPSAPPNPEALRGGLVCTLWRGPLPERWGWTTTLRAPSHVTCVKHLPATTRGKPSHEVVVHSADGQFMTVGSFDTEETARTLRRILTEELASLLDRARGDEPSDGAPVQRQPPHP